MERTSSQTGKTILITGASSGIGYEVALALAKTGATIILLCRNDKKGEETKNKIAIATCNKEIYFFGADLSSQKQIRQVAQKILVQFQCIDVLINNAGCVISNRELSEDNVEQQWAVNYLAAFLLTQLLMPAIKKSKQGRIINVSSRAHGMGEVNFDDISMEKKYSASAAYNQSKLALILFTYQLAEKLAGSVVTVNAMYPGLVNTDIGLKASSTIYRLFWRCVRLFGSSAEKGAETIVYLAISPQVNGVSGKYFGNCTEQKSSPASYDKLVAQKLWSLSLQQTGL